MEAYRTQIKIKDPKHFGLRIGIARLLVGIITVFILQAAFAFIFSPGGFVYAYELSGAAGEAAVRGFGVLFLMWNVPYLFAILDPVRYRLALYFAMFTQLIGLIGVSCIFFTLSVEHVTLRNTNLRFIVFNAIGLLLLAIAYFLVKDSLPYKYGQTLGTNGRLNVRL